MPRAAREPPSRKKFPLAFSPKGAPPGPKARYYKDMNESVVNEQGQEVGYYFWCPLARAVIAVLSSGPSKRATARHAFQARRWIEENAS